MSLIETLAKFWPATSCLSFDISFVRSERRRAWYCARKAKKRPTKEQKKAETEARLALEALSEKAEDGNTPLMRASAALRDAAAANSAKAAAETAAKVQARPWAWACCRRSCRSG